MVALSRVLWVSEILLFIFGISLLTVFSTVTSLVQLIVPDERVEVGSKNLDSARTRDEHLHGRVPWWNPGG
jgi:hypothetical protein